MHSILLMKFVQSGVIINLTSWSMYDLPSEDMWDPKIFSIESAERSLFVDWEEFKVDGDERPLVLVLQQ